MPNFKRMFDSFIESREIVCKLLIQYVNEHHGYNLKWDWDEVYIDIADDHSDIEVMWLEDDCYEVYRRCLDVETEEFLEWAKDHYELMLFEQKLKEIIHAE